MIRLNRKEVSLLFAVLTHPAGFSVDLLGFLGLRSTNQGIFEVDWEDVLRGHPAPIRFAGGRLTRYRTFKSPLRAVATFCWLRQKWQVGVDIEAQLVITL